MTQPLVTVYIATHNRPQMLHRALQSVFAQSYPNIEIIVADDGSAPPAADTLAKTLTDEQRAKIKIVRNETPQGACHARNLALAAADGEFITGLDDDDAFAPQRVEELLDAFIDNEKKQPLACVAACITEVTAEGQITRQFDHGRITLNMMRHYNFIGNQVFTRTDYLRRVDGFDPEMPAMQDYDTWLRLMERFGPAIKLKSASYLWYTDHEQGRITKSTAKRARAFDIFLQKHRHTMSKNQLNSMRIIELKMKGQSLTGFEAVRRVNRYNYRSVVALLLQQYFGGLKRALGKIRYKG
ncbi:glycosyltransferase involved in cell wall biosynthesis [Idiomarina aquatica]|uniref:Glycosyltransferase involved in cell wall biosynthesis n=1 Tax=Idiomarina aquatica TaxID=1327752 RepID=A0A4R6PSY4_9GAMM|nr:glycosyltransferase [Idiomarina aquatica]TDP40247.1 glycosyltransferase involved in cell wall biosynthesis [Idiomarina aquatica]